MHQYIKPSYASFKYHKNASINKKANLVLTNSSIRLLLNIDGSNLERKVIKINRDIILDAYLDCMYYSHCKLHLSKSISNKSVKFLPRIIQHEPNNVDLRQGLGLFNIF